jgi:hypothetical protein
MTQQEIQNFLKEHPGYLKWGKYKIANKLGCTEEDVKAARKELNINIIKSPLQELLEENQIPESDVNHFWYKGKHFSVHAKNPQFNPEQQFKALIDEARKEVKPVEITKRIEPTNGCAVINIYDIHLDKRNVQNPNGGSEAVEDLVTELEEGFKQLIGSVLTHKPDFFILPVGNDLFTTNGFMKTTKKGTPQDPMVTHEMIFREGLGLIRTFIDILGQFGKVYVPIIYGNHSVDAEFYLGVCLETLYWNNENVTINNTSRARKYIQYEDNLFGFGHGDLEKKNIDKLPLIMATENPKLWGDTKYRTFFLGDVHHKQEFKFFRTKDNPGCTVQFLRSTSITDSWHGDNMFIGVPRTMEATIFNNGKGQIANYSINL